MATMRSKPRHDQPAKSGDGRSATQKKRVYGGKEREMVVGLILVGTLMGAAAAVIAMLSGMSVGLAILIYMMVGSIGTVLVSLVVLLISTAAIHMKARSSQPLHS